MFLHDPHWCWWRDERGKWGEVEGEKGGRDEGRGVEKISKVRAVHREVMQVCTSGRCRDG